MKKSTLPKKKSSLPKKKSSLLKWIILIESILLVIFAVLLWGPAGTTPTGQINKFVSPQDAFALMQENQNNPNFVIIDDRYPNVFNSGHIGNATNIPWGADETSFVDGVGKLDKNKIYLVYCETGCGEISRHMKGLGFREVYEIAGGFNAWSAAGLPIER